MIRRARILYLQFRAWFLEAQILNAESLLRDHEARLDACHKEIRRVKSELAMILPGRTLLMQALRRK